MASSAALPPGPAHMSSHDSAVDPVSTSARLSAMASSWRALVLHRRASVADGRDAARVAAVPAPRPTGESSERVAPAATQLVDVGQAGPGDEGDPGGRVVGHQQGLEVGVDRLGGGRAVAEERRPQRPHDPLGVAVQGRQPGDRVAASGTTCATHVGRSFSLIRRITALTNPLGTGAVDHPRQPDRLVDGGVGGDAHAEQLVDTEPQRVEDVVVDLRDGAARRPRR